MSIVPTSTPSVELGVDYITATAGQPSNAAGLIALGLDLVEQEVGCGARPRLFAWQGFAGVQAGSVQQGFDGHRAIVRASGAAARECARDVINCADNISRLDVQATVRSDNRGVAYAAELYRRLDGMPKRRGREISRTLITSNVSGDTLYLGRRISDSYGRIYNKSAEDKEKCEVPRWRYEIEFKRRAALAQAKAYAQAEDQETWCASRVYHWFADRGCTPDISPLERANDPGASRGNSEEVRRIQWLKIGVGPVVRELAAKYGWPDVMSIFGVPMAYSDRYINETLCGEE